MSERFLSGPLTSGRFQTDGAEVGEAGHQISKGHVGKLMVVFSIDPDVINQF